MLQRLLPAKSWPWPLFCLCTPYTISVTFSINWKKTSGPSVPVATQLTSLVLLKYQLSNIKLAAISCPLPLFLTFIEELPFFFYLTVNTHTASSMISTNSIRSTWSTAFCNYCYSPDQICYAFYYTHRCSFFGQFYMRITKYTWQLTSTSHGFPPLTTVCQTRAHTEFTADSTFTNKENYRRRRRSTETESKVPNPIQWFLSQKERKCEAAQLPTWY